MLSVMRMFYDSIIGKVTMKGVHDMLFEISVCGLAYE
jgi:hypothetical protein